MSSRLSNVDRAKVNAALVILHDDGRNTDDVTRVAQSLMNAGTPDVKAYETAFIKFLEREPAYRAHFMRVGQLIDASTPRTVAGYNLALTRYIETGDASSLNALQPSLEQDLIAMAAHTGDAGFVDGLDAPTAVAAATSSEAAVSDRAIALGHADRPGHGVMGFRPGDNPKPIPGQAPEPQGTT